jgi:hypothetical protein
MAETKALYEFIDFVEKFPALSMPVTLGEDTHHTFSTENSPLSDGLIEQFIAPLEPEAADEFTEYIPCFAIDCNEPFVALVWWKAELLRYQYILATFTEKGQPIDQKIIAYTLVNGQSIRRAVASIDEELSIHIIEGVSQDDVYDATSSMTRNLEVLPNGTIVKG